MRASRFFPRLRHRDDDETTVHPSDPLPSEDLLASVRATAVAVAVAEQQVAEPPETDERHVRQLAETIRSAAPCESCRKGRNH